MTSQIPFLGLCHHSTTGALLLMFQLVYDILKIPLFYIIIIVLALAFVIALLLAA